MIIHFNSFGAVNNLKFFDIKIMFVDHAPKNGLMRIPCPSARNKLLSIITMKYIIKAIVPLPLRLLLELVIPIGHAIRAMAMQLRGKAHL